MIIIQHCKKSYLYLLLVAWQTARSFGDWSRMVGITTNRVRGQRDLWGEASVDHFGCWRYIAPLFGILKSKWNIRQQLPRTRHLSTYHSLASHKGQADKFPESQVWEAHAQHCSDTWITSSHSTMLRISWRVTNAEFRQNLGWPLERVLMDVSLLSLEPLGVTRS